MGANMAEKKFVVPEILPILPVRDTVLFPGAVLPFDRGRESSLALVNALQGEEKMLGVVAQLDPRIEDPAGADLHKWARSQECIRPSNAERNVVIFLEGLQRIQIMDLIGLRPYLARKWKRSRYSRRSRYRARSAGAECARTLPRRGEPFTAAFRRFAIGGNEH